MVSRSVHAADSFGARTRAGPGARKSPNRTSARCTALGYDRLGAGWAANQLLRKIYRRRPTIGSGYPPGRGDDTKVAVYDELRLGVGLLGNRGFFHAARNLVYSVGHRHAPTSSGHRVLPPARGCGLFPEPRGSSLAGSSHVRSSERGAATAAPTGLPTRHVDGANHPRLPSRSGQSGPGGGPSASGGPLPYETCNHRSAEIGDCVPAVTGSLWKYPGGDQLGRDRPRD